MTTPTRIHREIRCQIGNCRRRLGWITVTRTSEHTASISYRIPKGGGKRTGPRGDWGEVSLYCPRHHWVDMGLGPVVANGIIRAYENNELPNVLGALKSFMVPPSERQYLVVEPSEPEDREDWEGAFDEIRFEVWVRAE